jgi:DNA-directed RNA polymerase subunit RPC12/RpoP
MIPWPTEDDDYACAPCIRQEFRRMQEWVNDLQSGMYINCVYCGHRYGPSDEVPASMAEVLKEHIERCPKHPMSALKRELEEAQERIDDLELALEEAGGRR